MGDTPGIAVLFSNPEPDDEATFDGSVEKWAEHVEEWACPKQWSKSFRDCGVDRSDCHRAPTATARSWSAASQVAIRTALATQGVPRPVATKRKSRGGSWRNRTRSRHFGM